MSLCRALIITEDILCHLLKEEQLYRASRGNVCLHRNWLVLDREDRQLRRLTPDTERGKAALAACISCEGVSRCGCALGDGGGGGTATGTKPLGSAVSAGTADVAASGWVNMSPMPPFPICERACLASHLLVSDHWGQSGGGTGGCHHMQA